MLPCDSSADPRLIMQPHVIAHWHSIAAMHSNIHGKPHILPGQYNKDGNCFSCYVRSPGFLEGISRQNIVEWLFLLRSAIIPLFLVYFETKNIFTNIWFCLIPSFPLEPTHHLQPGAWHVAADLLSVLGVNKWLCETYDKSWSCWSCGWFFDGFCMGRFAWSQNVLGPTGNTSKKLQLFSKASSGSLYKLGNFTRSIVDTTWKNIIKGPENNPGPRT